MFFVLKRKVLFAIGGAFLLLICAVSFFRSAKEVTACVANLDFTAPEVIIDAGHGGFDGGAVVGDAVEKDFNLAIAKRLCENLKSRGYSVIMSRDEDESLGAETAGATQKKRDIFYRAELMKKSPNAIFVSIHMNKFEKKSCKGAQLFYGRQNPESKHLADVLQGELRAQLQPWNRRVPKCGGSDIYLLKTAKSPAVIVECGFLSNAEELLKLKDESYQEKLARVLADGIDRFYSESEKVGS